MLTRQTLAAPALTLSAITVLAILAACTSGPPVPHGGYRVNEMQPEERRVLSQPRFEHFPPYLILASEAAVPDLDSDPRAKEYRTALRKAAEKGASFAGHLAVASWPCGGDCTQWAFVDVGTGDVTWGPKTAGKARFQKDSRLFVADTGDDARYFVWTGRELKPLEG